MVNADIIAWEQESILDRIERCRALLMIHGLLTDKENEKVKARIAKLKGSVPVAEKVAGKYTPGSGV